MCLIEVDDLQPWMEESIDPGYDLRGVWAPTGSFAVAVGRYTPDKLQWGEAVLLYNGTSWNDVSTGRSNALFDVWGASASDVYAVGWAGLILHYDGAAWAVADSGRATELHSVHGSGSNDIYAVGSDGVFPQGAVMRFNGSTWERSLHDRVEECYGFGLAARTMLS